MTTRNTLSLLATAALALSSALCGAQESAPPTAERTEHRIVRIGPGEGGPEAMEKDRRVVRVFTTSNSAHGNEDGQVVWVDDDGTGSYAYSFGLGRSRGYLGVQLLGMTAELRSHFGAPEDAGVLVSLVADDSPASAAGLRVGDIVTSIDGQDVSVPAEVARRISGFEDGASASLEVWRDRRVQTLSVTIEERERPAFDIGQFVAPGLGQIRQEIKMGMGHIPDQVIEIDTDGIHDALKDLQLQFEDPMMFEKFQVLGQDRLDLQERIQELEARLKELESHLDKLPQN